jgi:hypothetical protein
MRLWSQCAVKAYGENAEMPRGVQAPLEPLELSFLDHFRR